VQDEIAESFDIEEVPTFLVLRVSYKRLGIQLRRDISPFESLTCRGHRRATLCWLGMLDPTLPFFFN
jgi:hypothetical protein